MQQLTIEHKNTVEKKDRRGGKGRVLAISRRTYRLQNTDTFYVESETSDNLYYFVRFNPDVFEWWCSCKDNSTRHIKCKHLFTIKFAIKLTTIKNIEKLPVEAKRYSDSLSEATITQEQESKSYMDDEYSF